MHAWMVAYEWLHHEWCTLMHAYLNDFVHASVYGLLQLACIFLGVLNYCFHVCRVVIHTCMASCSLDAGMHTCMYTIMFFELFGVPGMFSECLPAQPACIQYSCFLKFSMFYGCRQACPACTFSCSLGLFMHGTNYLQILECTLLVLKGLHLPIGPDQRLIHLCMGRHVSCHTIPKQDWRERRIIAHACYRFVVSIILALVAQPLPANFGADGLRRSI